MPKYTFIIIILSYCVNLIHAQENCSRVTPYGDVEICLPSIDGYSECYLNPVVKGLADHFEAPMNMVLGYYLPDSIYAKVDVLDQLSYDNYFKVYANKEMGTVKAGKKELEAIYKEVAENTISKNWSEVKGTVEGKLEGLQIGIPTVIEQYSLNDASKSLVMVINYSLGDESLPVIMAVSFIVVKERMVFLAYYLNYKNEDTIEKLKTNSSQIIESLISEN